MDANFSTAVREGSESVPALELRSQEHALNSKGVAPYNVTKQQLYEQLKGRNYGYEFKRLVWQKEQ